MGLGRQGQAKVLKLQACSQTLYFPFNVRRARVIKNKIRGSLRASFPIYGQAKRASRERASEGPLRRSLARSHETRFTRPNKRACSQAKSAGDLLNARG